MRIRFKTDGMLTWVSLRGDKITRHMSPGVVIDFEVEETSEGIVLQDNGFYALVDVNSLEQVD